jgi:hypothetical protein
MMYSQRTSVRHRQACTVLTAIIMVIAVLVYAPTDAAPVAVRSPEGVIHGYFLVRSHTGETIGQGELIQLVKEGGPVESHVVFRFKDGSLHDEKVAFSQQRVFTMIRYRLIQRGPLFPEQIDVTVDRETGQYTVRSQAGKDGKEEVFTGRLDLPTDVYNGMLVVALKNLLKGADKTVSFLVFTPKPEIIKLQLLLMGEQPVHIGNLSGKASLYVFKPQIGKIREFFGKVFGKLPADFHYDCWIVADEVPSFVQFEGPLQLMGPIVRVELVSPRLTAKPKD